MILNPDWVINIKTAEKNMSEVEKESSKELLEIYEKELKELDESLRCHVVYYNSGLKCQIEIVQKIHALEDKIQSLKIRMADK